MKKIIVLLMLATSITGKICAQGNQRTSAISNTDKTFETPVNSIFRRFMVDLGKGNKMQLELTALEDLDHISNIDSLVNVFLHDLQPLKDSLSNELLSKRIDYTIDSMGRKKIRLLQYPPKGSSFLVDQNDVAALKLEQDTVNIIGSYRGNTAVVLSKKNKSWHYYRIRFFINQLSELPGYLNGSLNEKVIAIKEIKKGDWGGENDGQLHYSKDRSITAQQPQGYLAGTGDYLNIGAGMGIQNYKNYFAPSFNLYAKVFINSEHHTFEAGASWEPHFLFAKNSQGNLQTYRNDFVTLTLGREPRTGAASYNDNGTHFTLLKQISFGYLIRQKGDFFDDHTFRIGTGAVKWKGEKIKLEPVFYFHDAFKNVTPGLRVSVNF